MILTFDLTGEGDEYKKLPCSSMFGPYAALIDSGDQGNVVCWQLQCTVRCFSTSPLFNTELYNYSWVNLVPCGESHQLCPPASSLHARLS